MLVPFIDPSEENATRSRIVSLVGVVAVIYMVGMTAYGYRSWLAVGIMVATGALIWLMGLATAQPAGGKR
jgi:heme A synthase